ncbi:MAG: DUF1295 domain-containing protein [Thermoleophilia bacterium]
MTAGLVAGLVAAVLLFAACWAASLPRDDVSIVDVLWGPAFAVVGLVYAAVAGAGGVRAWLAPVLVCIWGIRLGVHLGLRKRGQPEDHRYAAMRERRPETFRWRSLPTVFMLQAAIVWVVSWPLLVAVHDRHPAAMTALDWAGVLLFAVGLAFEAVGDLQLTRFRGDPSNRGGVMDRGLWRYTRHPNYFGDALVWWGLTLIALGGGWHLWVLVSPVVMSALLMRFSGVGMLERHMSQRPGYREYMRRTNAFFPGPPRRAA